MIPFDFLSIITITIVLIFLSLAAQVTNKKQRSLRCLYHNNCGTTFSWGGGSGKLCEHIPRSRRVLLAGNWHSVRYEDCRYSRWKLKGHRKWAFREAETCSRDAVNDCILGHRLRGRAVARTPPSQGRRNRKVGAAHWPPGHTCDQMISADVLRSQSHLLCIMSSTGWHAILADMYILLSFQMQ